MIVAILLLAWIAGIPAIVALIGHYRVGEPARRGLGPSSAQRDAGLYDAPRSGPMPAPRDAALHDAARRAPGSGQRDAGRRHLRLVPDVVDRACVSAPPGRTTI